MKLALRVNALVSFLDNNFRWVVIALMLMVVLFGTFILILPKWNSVSQLGLITLERERDLTKEREAYLAQLKQSLQSFRQFTSAQRTLLERVLPTSFDIGETFVEMSRLFSNAGYELSQISVALQGQQQATVTAPSLSDTSDPDVQALANEALKNSEAVFLNENLRVVTLTLNLAGSQSYGDIKQLLSAIEQHEHLMDIRSVGFSIQDEVLQEEETTSGGAITVTANIYYFEAS